MSGAVSTARFGRPLRPCEQVVAEVMRAPRGGGGLDAAYDRYGLDRDVPKLLFSLDPFQSVRQSKVKTVFEKYHCKRSLSLLLLKRGQRLPDAAGDDADATLDDGRFRLVGLFGPDLLLHGPESSVFLVPCDSDEYRRYPNYVVEWFVFWGAPLEEEPAWGPVVHRGPEGVLSSERIPSWTQGTPRWRSGFSYKPWPLGQHLIFCRIQALDRTNAVVGPAAYYSATLRVVTPGAAVAVGTAHSPRTPIGEWANAQDQLGEHTEHLATVIPPMESRQKDHEEQVAGMKQWVHAARKLADLLEERRIQAWPIDAWWFSRRQHGDSSDLRGVAMRYAEAGCRGESGSGEAGGQPDQVIRMLLLAREHQGRWRWALFDWTDIRLEGFRLRGGDYDRVFEGSFDSYAGSVDEAVKQWQGKNRYAPGLVALRVPPGVGDRDVTGDVGRIWTFKTNGRTRLDGVGVLLATGSLALLVGAVVVPVLAPTLKILALSLRGVSAAMGSAAAVTGIVQNMDHGARDWTPYVLDALAIVASCLRMIQVIRQAGGALRAGQVARLANGSQIRDPVYLSVVGVEGVEGVLIAGEHFSRIQQILEDETKTPLERLAEVGTYLAPVMAIRAGMGALSAGARRAQVRDSHKDPRGLVVPGDTRAAQSRHVLMQPGEGRKLGEPVNDPTLVNWNLSRSRDQRGGSPYTDFDRQAYGPPEILRNLDVTQNVTADWVTTTTIRGSVGPAIQGKKFNRQKNNLFKFEEAFLDTKSLQSLGDLRRISDVELRQKYGLLRTKDGLYRLHSDEWDNSHAWGSGFGSELAAGMRLARRQINQHWQNRGIEKYLREQVKDGARIEVQMYTDSWGRSQTPSQMALFFKEAHYRVKVLEPGQTDWKYFSVGISVPSPYSAEPAITLKTGPEP